MLAQKYFQPAQINRRLNPPPPAQFQNDAVPILKLNDPWPACTVSDD
jgi:hypothetical protein